MRWTSRSCVRYNSSEAAGHFLPLLLLHRIRRAATRRVEIATGSPLFRSQKAQTDALNEALNSLGTTATDPEDLSREIRWLVEDCIRQGKVTA